MNYQLVIRNGTVVDGSGLAPYRADVGVVDGRIARIGRIRESGDQEIDAEGHVVTPGFIDGHTHMDAQIFWDPLGTPSCWHGITTVVMGNCGFTLAPAHADAQDLAITSIERAEDISRAAMAAGIGEWSWETFPEYLDAVDALPKGINVAAQVGHSALRTWAMGERAFSEPATEDDMVAMERQLAESMAAGAIGFSTSRDFENHRTTDDRFVPPCFATWEELSRLVGVLGDAGRGVFEMASEPDGRSTDAEVRSRWQARVTALAVETGVPITGPISLRLIDTTAAAGGRMFGQVHSRGITNISSFRSRLPFDVLAEWREVRSQPLEGQRVLLADPEVRQRLVWAAHHGDYPAAVGAEPPIPDYDRLRVFDDVLPPHPSVAEAAALRGVDPVELMIDLALASDFDQLFFQPLGPVDPDYLLRAMKHPRTVTTFSDAGAHVSQISDCSIQTYLLAYWMREKGAFTLEEAVSMLTLRPAVLWGLTDRGLLRQGMVADINVFDPQTVAPRLPTIVPDLPGGSIRLVQRADGFLATVVAGQVVHAKGEPTGALPGRLLRAADAG